MQLSPAAGGALALCVGLEYFGTHLLGQTLCPQACFAADHARHGFVAHGFNVHNKKVAAGNAQRYQLNR